MRKHIAAFCVGLAWIAAGAVGTTSAAASSTDRAEQRLVDRVNVVRERHGLQPLAISPSLARSAGRYSQSQLERNYFGHAPRIQASPRYRTLGEVLAIHVGTQPLVGFTVHNWMHSPIHTEVLLYRSFRYIGAGRAIGRFGGSRRTTVWTVQFGR